MVALYHLNEIQGGMLLSGAADGSVRVWRNFSHRGAQRLASAWRVRGSHTHHVPSLIPLIAAGGMMHHHSRKPEGLDCLILAKDDRLYPGRRPSPQRSRPL